MKLIKPFKTCDEGTSPGCTLAERKTIGFRKIIALSFFLSSGCKIGSSINSSQSEVAPILPVIVRRSTLLPSKE